MPACNRTDVSRLLHSTRPRTSGTNLDATAANPGMDRNESLAIPRAEHSWGGHTVTEMEDTSVPSKLSGARTRVRTRSTEVQVAPAEAGRPKQQRAGTAHRDKATEVQVGTFRAGRG